MTTIIRRALPVIAAVAALCSCGKEEYSDGTMRFKVRSGATRAAETVTEGLNVNGHVFVLDAWLEAENRQSGDAPHFVSAADVTCDGSQWKGDGLYWRNQVYTNFWATYPKTADGRGSLTWADNADATQKTPTFTYDMSSYAAGNAAAENTPDLLAAYYRGVYNADANTGGTVTFQFEHLLSGIRFKNKINSGYTIQSIAISGIYYSGTCTLTGSETQTLAASWTPGSATDKTFTQEVTTMPDENGYFADGKFMFFIPQELADGQAKITMTIDSTGVIRNIPKFTWKPGYKYDYTLTYTGSTKAGGLQPDDLEITVREYKD